MRVAVQGEGTPRFVSQASDIFPFGRGGEAEPVCSAAGRQCPRLGRGRSQRLPPSVPCPGPSTPPRQCSAAAAAAAEQGIRSWQRRWGLGGHSSGDKSAQPPGGDSAGPRSGAAVGPGSRLGWPRGRSGRRAAEGTGWRGSPGERARGGQVPGPAAPARPRKEAGALCASRACASETPPAPGRQEAAPVEEGLRLARSPRSLVPGFLPALLAGRQG